MPTPAFCVYGVFSRRVTVAGYPNLTVTTVTNYHPQGRTADFTHIPHDGDSDRGYPKNTVTIDMTVTHGAEPPVSHSFRCR